KRTAPPRGRASGALGLGVAFDHIPVYQYDAPVHYLSIPAPGFRMARSSNSSLKMEAMASSDSHEFYERLGSVIRCLRAVAADTYAAFEVGSAQAKFLRHIGRNSRISQADL